MRRAFLLLFMLALTIAPPRAIEVPGRNTCTCGSQEPSASPVGAACEAQRHPFRHLSAAPSGRSDSQRHDHYRRLTRIPNAGCSFGPEKSWPPGDVNARRHQDFDAAAVVPPGLIDTHSHLGVYPAPASRRSATAMKRPPDHAAGSGPAFRLASDPQFPRNLARRHDAAVAARLCQSDWRRRPAQCAGAACRDEVPRAKYGLRWLRRNPKRVYGSAVPHAQGQRRGYAAPDLAERYRRKWTVNVDQKGDAPRARSRMRPLPMCCAATSSYTPLLSRRRDGARSTSRRVRLQDPLLSSRRRSLQIARPPRERDVSASVLATGAVQD